MLQIQDLGRILSLPHLTNLEIYYTWGQKSDNDLSVPQLPAPNSQSRLSAPSPIHTLSLSHNNPNIILSIVEFVGHKLVRARIYTECFMPPSEARKAWSTTTETLRVLEHQTNSPIRAYDELWLQRLLPDFKRLERLSTCMSHDVDAQILWAAPPTLATLQLIHYEDDVDDTLEDWKDGFDGNRMTSVRKVEVVLEEVDDTSEYRDDLVDSLRKYGLEISLVGEYWSEEELFDIWCVEIPMRRRRG